MGIKVSFRKHTEKDGRTTLYARFKIPERQEDGSITLRYVERSARTGKRVEARRFAEGEYQKAYDEANRAREGEVGSDTFAAAAKRYMLNGGSRRYLYQIIEQIGLKKLDEVNQAVVTDLVQKLYPGCTAATVNRHVFTPIVAVMTFAKHPHKLERPKGHDSLPQLDIPPDSWYAAVLPVANPWARAFLITNRLHGRRPGELLNRTREHFDAELETLLVRDNKGDQNILVQLAKPAAIAIKALPDLRLAEKVKQADGKRLTHGMRHALFGTFRPETMRAWLADACKEAGVRYYMPKEAGRHAFVTKNLEAGKSLKWVQDSGRWKTLKVVAEKYGHLERQEVDRQARAAGEEWFTKILTAPLQIEGDPKGKKPVLDLQEGSIFLGDSAGDDGKKRA